MGTNEKPNVFNVLNAINVNEHTDKKGNLTYLSWAWAWQVTKQNFPNSQYKVYENNDGWNYFTDGRTAWVKVSVTINELEHIEYLPIMDFKNKSIPINNVTSFEVNKAIQRALTKAIARHGLGLYIYAGEDLPSEDDGSQNIQPVEKEFISLEQAKGLANYVKEQNQQLSDVMSFFKVGKLSELTVKQYQFAMNKVKNKEFVA